MSSAASHLSLRKLAAFLVVGGGATLLHYLIAALLWRAGLAPALASGIGFALSAVFNYFANARFTFRVRTPHSHGLPRFVLVASIGCALNSGVLWVLVELGMNVVLAQLLATTAVLAWNFLLSAVWTFRQPESH